MTFYLILDRESSSLSSSPISTTSTALTSTSCSIYDQQHSKQLIQTNNINEQVNVNDKLYDDDEEYNDYEDDINLDGSITENKHENDELNHGKKMMYDQEADENEDINNLNVTNGSIETTTTLSNSLNTTRNSYINNDLLANSSNNYNNSSNIDNSDSSSSMVCKICNKSFDNTHRLQRHMMCHDMNPNLRKFKCDYCSKAFKFKHHLKVRYFKNCIIFYLCIFVANLN